MAKTPVVLIHSGAGASLESFYESVMADWNARHHQPGNSFPTYTLSAAELAEQAALSSHAAHASDGVQVKGNQVSTDGGKTWTHIERLVR